MSRTAAGPARRRANPPGRVVSLVPSLTESLFELGLGDRLAAVTDYCVHPAPEVAALPRIGGTKNPRIAEIVALRPDLVLANQEENRPEDVQSMRESGLNVWVTFPCTVREALDLLWDIVRRFEILVTGERLAALEHIVDWTRAAAAAQQPTPVFCPIWRARGGAEWWMTANSATYLHDLLALCGGRNVFADRQRRYPLAADLGDAESVSSEEAGRDTRYPRVPLAEVIAAQPQVILLPSEPFAFTAADRQDLLQIEALPAAQTGRIHLVDGSLLTWHGTRLARALQDIPPLLAPA